MKITLGADPEVFLHNGIHYVSAFGKFPGTKKEPFKVKKGAIQVDGMALEFNIDPAETEEEFSDNIETVKKQMLEMVKDVDPELELKFTPFAKFDKEYFDVQPLDAKILGCDPDFDKDGKMKIPPEGFQDLPFRTAAGHVHIGWGNVDNPMDAAHFEDCRFLSATFVPVAGFSPSAPEEWQRVKYYGGNGSFRPKKYGVELRMPSNHWVASPDKQKQMFRNVKKVMDRL